MHGSIAIECEEKIRLIRGFLGRWEYKFNLFQCASSSSQVSEDNRFSILDATLVFFLFPSLLSFVTYQYLLYKAKNTRNLSCKFCHTICTRFTRIQIIPPSISPLKESRDWTNQWNVQRSKSLGSHSIPPTTVELTTFRLCATYFKHARSFHLKFTSTIFLPRYARLFIRMKARGALTRLDTFIRSQQSSEYRASESLSNTNGVLHLWSMRIEIAA